MLFFFLLNVILLQLFDHIKTLLNLFFELFLKVYDSVDIYWLVLIITPLLVHDLGLFLIIGAWRKMTEWSVVFDRHDLVECPIVHKQDFFIVEAEVILSYRLVSEACLYCTTTDHILTVQVMIVFKEIVKIALCLLALFRLLTIFMFKRMALQLVPLFLIVSSLIARLTPVKSLLFLIFLITGIDSLG